MNIIEIPYSINNKPYFCHKPIFTFKEHLLYLLLILVLNPSYKFFSNHTLFHTLTCALFVMNILLQRKLEANSPLALGLVLLKYYKETYYDNQYLIYFGWGRLTYSLSYYYIPGNEIQPIHCEELYRPISGICVIITLLDGYPSFHRQYFLRKDHDIKHEILMNHITLSNPSNLPRHKL